MICNLLYGTDKKSEERLEALKKSIGDNPKLLWYPSAGDDYRDLLELSETKAQKHNIKELPDLHIHTDYMPNWITLEGTAYDDGKTIVEIEDKFELKVHPIINYYVDKKFVDFENDAPKIPTVYLLDISITSDSLGTIKKPVLYFIFENINFLDEVLIKNGIEISHLVKVREGCGFGGNRKSISIIYAFLSVLKPKYLLIDYEEHTDFNLINHLIKKHALSVQSTLLNKIDSIQSWSGFHVNIYEVTINNEPLNEEYLKINLEMINFELKRKYSFKNK